MLFNEPKLLKCCRCSSTTQTARRFSALQRAEIAEIFAYLLHLSSRGKVSVLFNEPKLLKFQVDRVVISSYVRFSALQRAEIAEIRMGLQTTRGCASVSVLFNEPKLLKCRRRFAARCRSEVSVLFNEPKLLKLARELERQINSTSFSALQRAEIAEMVRRQGVCRHVG